MQGNQEGGGKAALGLFTCFGAPWALAVAQGGPGVGPGHRYVLSLRTFVGYALLTIWAGLSMSNAMHWLWALLCLMGLIHAATAKRRAGTPTTYCGTPLLAGTLGHKGAWAFWSLGGFALGACLLEIERPVGMWLMIAGASVALQFGGAYSRAAHLDDDLADAQLDAVARANRTKF